MEEITSKHDKALLILTVTVTFYLFFWVCFNVYVGEKKGICLLAIRTSNYPSEKFCNEHIYKYISSGVVNSWEMKVESFEAA